MLVPSVVLPRSPSDTAEPTTYQRQKSTHGQGHVRAPGNERVETRRRTKRHWTAFGRRLRLKNEPLRERLTAMPEERQRRAEGPPL